MWRFITSLVTPYTTIGIFLKQQHFSQTLRRRIRREGRITKNGCSASFNDFLTSGDELTVSLPGSTQQSAVGTLDVIFEDDFFLAVNKPAGLVTHPLSAAKEVSLLNIALQYCRNKDPNSSLHPVMRLDRNTSGLLLFTKNPRDHHLVEQYGIKKTYLALLERRPPSISGDIYLPIARKPGSIIERHVSAVGQAAHTSYHIIKAYPHYTLAEFKLHTGRTHQIRVHAAACGFPLVGADLYGLSKVPSVPGQALHAWQLTFYHPHTCRRICLHAPVPASWRALFAH